MDTLQPESQAAPLSHSLPVFRPAVHNLCESIAQKDLALLSGHKTYNLLSEQIPDVMDDWQAFQDSWNRLVHDLYRKDGGTYRLRRHATYSANPTDSNPAPRPHQPHYQSLDCNNLNGDIAQHFAPIEPASACNLAGREPA